MLKANELRVGNIVSTVKLNNGIVRGITDEKIMVKFKDSTISSNIDFFYPIPLTEEILLKCGFDEKSTCLSKMLNTADTYLEIRERNNEYYVSIYQFTESSYDDNNTVFLNKINHIHQLQNLYFALTNEELTIKL